MRKQNPISSARAPSTHTTQRGAPDAQASFTSAQFITTRFSILRAPKAIKPLRCGRHGQLPPLTKKKPLGVGCGCHHKREQMRCLPPARGRVLLNGCQLVAGAGEFPRASRVSRFPITGRPLVHRANNDTVHHLCRCSPVPVDNRNSRTSAS